MSVVTVTRWGLMFRFCNFFFLSKRPFLPEDSHTNLFLFFLCFFSVVCEMSHPFAAGPALEGFCLALPYTLSSIPTISQSEIILDWREQSKMGNITTTVPTTPRPHMAGNGASSRAYPYQNGGPCHVPPKRVNPTG